MRTTASIVALAALSAANVEASFHSSLRNLFSDGQQQQQQQPLVSIDLAAEDPAYQRVHCPENSPFSCSMPNAADTCCYEATNGVFVASQKWEAGVGAPDLFTTHGLWPNKCSGGFSESCDSTRAVGNVTEVLTTLGYKSLVRELERSWKAVGSSAGDDQSLWTSEFNKHGTCMSTLSPNCYGEFEREGQNVADFFATTVNLQRRLPTYFFLKNAGILPSDTEKVSRDVVLAALKGYGHGHKAYLKCENDALTEVRYYFSLKGSVSAGEFVSIDADKTSDCPAEFWYKPKYVSSEPASQQPINLAAAAPGGGYPFPPIPGAPTHGHLIADAMPGCLDNNGTWFVGGLCGNFTKTPDAAGKVTLVTESGNCALNGTGVLSCSPDNADPTPFTFISFGFFADVGFLFGSADGNWSAAALPTGPKAGIISPPVPISAGTNTSGPINFKLKFVPMKLVATA